MHNNNNHSYYTIPISHIEIKIQRNDEMIKNE